MTDIWENLKATKKPIVLYGMGNGADKIISVCENNGVKISGVFASDGFVRPKTFHGMTVTDYRTAKSAFGDMVVLLCFGTALGNVIANIKRIAEENELYAPDVPVYGDTLFCKTYYHARKDEFDLAYSLLADEISKKVFENTVKYKLTGKIEYLFDCETDENEAYDSFLKLKDCETYLDMGAYRGDTVLSFCEHVKDWVKIVAVEPDKKSYEKLCAVTSKIKRAIALNACICDKVGKCGFAKGGSRGSHISADSNTTDVISADSLNISPTFIKMDIEGAESAAIEGAKRTISRCKPKMQIAAYHRSGDLVDILKAVFEIRSDYRVYLRHNPCLPAWDINYFFI